MSAMIQLQQSPYCPRGKITSTTDMVHVIMITKIGSEVTLRRSWCKYCRDFFAMENFAEDCAKELLVNVGIPQTFFNGHDCNMIENLARMLRASTQHRRGVAIDYVYVFVSVIKGYCFYNIVNTRNISRTPHLPSLWAFSLPAGSTSLRRFKVDDKEENCAICLEGFNSDDAAKLPCSHVCHYNCILEWFVKSGTCPLCRFPCSLASRYA